MRKTSAITAFMKSIHTYLLNRFCYLEIISRGLIWFIRASWIGNVIDIRYSGGVLECRLGASVNGLRPWSSLAGGSLRCE